MSPSTSSSSLDPSSSLSESEARATTAPAPVPQAAVASGASGASVASGASPSNPPSRYPQPGEILAGKYKVEEVLGTGGMGVVVAARHIQLDERVAIKLLLPEFIDNDEVVARFLREGRAAIKIHSQHVVRILDVDALETGAPYLVMECLDGQDLEGLVRDHGPVPVPRAIDLLLQAGEALAEAHALGIVHRDLKPANLFLVRCRDESECIKVLDFGISKIHKRTKGADEARITSTTAIMGSPQYMSPEQLRSTRDVDARTDIWAFGAILHELLTGTPPFGGDTMPVICAAILKEPPPHLRETHPDIPIGVETGVLRCLEKDPEARFANMAEVAAALAPFGTEAARASVERICRILHAIDLADPVAFPVVTGGADADADRALLVHAVVPTTSVTTETSWSTKHPVHRPHALRNTTFFAVAAAGAILGLVGVHSYVSPNAVSGAPASPTLAATVTIPAPSNEPTLATVPLSSAELTSANMAAPPSTAPAPANAANADDAGVTIELDDGKATAPANVQTTAKATTKTATHARAHHEADGEQLFDERK